MANAVRKISLAQALRQGDPVLEFWCLARREGQPPPYSGAPNVCGHHAVIAIEVAIEKFGAETSLSDIPGVCTVCGGRTIDVRAWHSTGNHHRHF